jgi:hypothetical protein
MASNKSQWNNDRVLSVDNRCDLGRFWANLHIVEGEIGVHC